MIELTMTRNDNAIYDIHFKTSDIILAKNMHQLLLAQLLNEPNKVGIGIGANGFDKSGNHIDLDELRKLQKMTIQSVEESLDNNNIPQEVFDKALKESEMQVVDNEQPKTGMSAMGALYEEMEEKARIEREEKEKSRDESSSEEAADKEELFEEKDFQEDYSQYKGIEFGDEETDGMPSSDNNDIKKGASEMLESTEEAAKRINNEEKEKAEKRKTFYSKVLYEISKDSHTLYSLLSLGYPVSSNGGTLMVNLPNEAYKMVTEDKRVKTVVSEAIKKVSNNSSVNIVFQPEGEMSIEDKLKNRLDAEEVEIPY